MTECVCLSSTLRLLRASHASARNLDQRFSDDLCPPCTGVARVRLPGQGLSTMMNKYGTRKGRLKYRTKAEGDG